MSATATVEASLLVTSRRDTAYAGESVISGVSRVSSEWFVGSIVITHVRVDNSLFKSGHNIQAPIHHVICIIYSLKFYPCDAKE